MVQTANMSGQSTDPDDRLWLQVEGGVSLAVYRWDVSDGPVKAVIHIAHGLAEHALRYGYAARALNRAGYLVFAHDHRGHGGSDTGTQGYFGPERGWDLVVEDIYRVNRHVAEQHPALKRVAFGHSMGSFVTQDFLSRHGDAVSAAVFSGTSGGNAWLTSVGEQAARLARSRVGKQGTSQALEFLVFGPYNLGLSPRRTKFDWLSRDNHQVDLYIEDPNCGFAMPAQTWIDMFTGMTAVQQRSLQTRIPRDLPIWMMSGTHDPVGRKTAGVRWLAARYRELGMTRVETRFYQDARHELVNEVNRDEVLGDLIGWLDRTLPSV